MNTIFRRTGVVAVVGILAVAGFACGGGDTPTAKKGQTTATVAVDLEKILAAAKSAASDPTRAAPTAVRETTTAAASKTAVAPTATPTKPAPTKAAPPAEPTAPPAPQTLNGLPHRGPGSFNSGEGVVGYEIAIGGLKYRLCYFASAPGSGTVKDGVINPYSGEVLSPCGQGVEDPDTVNGHFRRGPGAFVAGEGVTGFFTLNGKKYENCYLSSAPSGGTVTDGVINPWIKEAADDRVC